MYILPGGAIEKGEKPIKAATRELLEETGLKLQLKKLETVALTREKHYVYEAVVKDIKQITTIQKLDRTQ